MVLMRVVQGNELEGDEDEDEDEDETLPFFYIPLCIYVCTEKETPWSQISFLS